MAHSSLNDPASNPNFLSQKLSLMDLRDKLHDHLSQAAALASVASGDDFLDFHQDVLRDYLWTLQNLVISALETYGMMDDRLSHLMVSSKGVSHVR
jgi:hypothetical protein